MNDAQVEAITTRIPNVLVSAGAGSGKTTVLTQRYFHLLDDLVDGKRLQLDEILTLTFTRKAAQEMRERIARKLEAEGRHYERKELARAPIGTIHGFCEGVLREHALQAGIDPNFRLLDEAEARTLQENALDTIFEDLWSGSRQERVDIGRLLLDVPQRRLRSGLLGIFRDTRTRGVAVDELAPLAPLPLSTAAAQLHAAMAELLALAGTAKWQDNLRQAAQAHAEIRPVLAGGEAFNWDRYYQVQQAAKTLTPAGGPKTLAKAARDAVHAAHDGWLSAYLDLAAQAYLAAFLTLLKRFTVAYRCAKDEQGLLDFEDLLLTTRDLLLQESGGAVERLRKKFRQVMVDEFQDTNPLQFSIIRALQGENHLFMVGDVKQAIYRFIGSDIRVFLNQEQRILALEGDGLRIPMHTNYRTRPEILEPLNGLFSRLWPLDAVEAGFTFEPLSAGRTFSAKEIPSVELALWPCEEGSAAELRDREASWIARRILQLTGVGDASALPLTAEGAAGEEIHARPACFGDIMLLFRASTDIPLYEDALRRAGIPFYTVSGRGFYGTREVQDLLYFLRVLENPMDDFSLAVVLRSPLVGVSDDTLYWLSRDWSVWTDGAPYPGNTAPTAQYGRLWGNINALETLPPFSAHDRACLLSFRALLGDLQAELAAGQPLDLLDVILARTNYAHVLLAGDGGEQHSANVQKLREVAATFQARGIFDLSDFQRYLTQLSDQAPREASAPLDVESSNVVRLLTIHAAKGLEASIVFLADGGREPMALNDTFLYTPEGLACAVPTPEDTWERPATYLRAAATLTRADRREAERLLYVALTRAREHLICCGFTKYPERDKQASYADLLAGLLDLTGPLDEDAAVPVTFDDTAFPVRVWSPAALRAVEALQPPAPSPTLWETYREEILHGGELPLRLDATRIEAYARLNDRLQPLPLTRREGPLRIGVHRALCYQSCPRQYWLRYILHDEGKMSPILPDSGEAVVHAEEDDDDARMDGTAFGRLLHAVLQQIDFTQSLPEQLPTCLDSLSTTESLIMLAEGDQQRLADCLRTFMAMPCYADLQRATVVQRELRFLTRVGHVFVPGIIDLLALIDGEWWIIDYKTGRPSANHLRQVAIYALGILEAFAVPPTRGIIAYLDDPGPRNLRDEPITSALLDEARRIIRTAEEGIRAEQYGSQQGRHCDFCPFGGACAKE